MEDTVYYNSVFEANEQTPAKIGFACNKERVFCTETKSFLISCNNNWQLLRKFGSRSHSQSCFRIIYLQSLVTTANKQKLNDFTVDT